MRMWMVEPTDMCQKHLCGEHLETHMLLSCMKQNKKLTGFAANNLLEAEALFHRHKALAEEMVNRGYNHKSPIDHSEFIEALAKQPEDIRNSRVDGIKSYAELCSRCEKCSAIMDANEALLMLT